jgi:hypothetical protein
LKITFCKLCEQNEKRLYSTPWIGEKSEIKEQDLLNKKQEQGGMGVVAADAHVLAPVPRRRIHLPDRGVLELPGDRRAFPTRGTSVPPPDRSSGDQEGDK